jgi:hypothetical protein
MRINLIWMWKFCVCVVFHGNVFCFLARINDISEEMFVIIRIIYGENVYLWFFWHFKCQRWSVDGVMLLKVVSSEVEKETFNDSSSTLY